METPANEEQGAQLADRDSLDKAEREDSSLPPFPPRPEPESADANGWDVATQYRAIQEAQQLHEETLKQLRSEILEQKERLSELSETAGSSSRAPQLDAVFLRLSELERKIGQDAPDPLLNEIVHRLAALENNPQPKQSGKDSRVDELMEQVEKLRRRSAEPSSDPRVDDIVLRIAAIESTNKRSTLSAELEGLSARLQEARTELEESRRSDLSVFQQELHSLSEKVELLSNDAGSEERFEAIDRRLSEVSEASASARIELESQIEAAVERLPDPADAENEAARWQELEGRLDALEQSPAPATAESQAALGEQISQLRAQLESLSERTADTPSPQRVLDLETRLEEVANRAFSSEPTELAAELRERIFLIEDRVTGEAGVGARLTALEESTSSSTELPEEWVDKFESIRTRLEALEDLSERVGRLETESEDLNSVGLVDLTARLRSLEVKSENQADRDEIDVEGIVAGLREEIAQLRDGGSVDELRTELEALREQSAKDESDGLRNRIVELEGRLSDIESVNRLESSGSRLDSLEEKLRSLDDVSDLGRRLTVLEMSAQESAAKHPDGLADRLAALEQRSGEATGTTDPEVRELLEALQDRLDELEAHPASASGDAENPDESWRETAAALDKRLSLVESAESGDNAANDLARIDLLSDRLAALEARGAEGAGGSSIDDEARARIESLADDLQRIREDASNSVGSEPVSDPRISELVERVTWMETSGGSGSTVDLGPLKLRLEALESREAPGMTEDEGMRTRAQEILDRLDHLETQGAPDASGALQKESERWSQWARSTLEEIGELRRQVEELEDRAPAAAGSPEGRLDAESLAALGSSISSGLSKGEVRSLRQQMYFIYFAIGTLMALAVLFLFLNLTS